MKREKKNQSRGLGCCCKQKWLARKRKKKDAWHLFVLPSVGCILGDFTSETPRVVLCVLHKAYLARRKIPARRATASSAGSGMARRALFEREDGVRQCQVELWTMEGAGHLCYGAGANTTPIPAVGFAFCGGDAKTHGARPRSTLSTIFARHTTPIRFGWTGEPPLRVPHTYLTATPNGRVLLRRCFFLCLLSKEGAIARKESPSESGQQKLLCQHGMAPQNKGDSSKQPPANTCPIFEGCGERRAVFSTRHTGEAREGHWALGNTLFVL